MKEVRNSENLMHTDSRTIVGYAIVFNTASVDLGGFREVVLPSAIDQDLLNRSDVLCLLDHNRNRGVLARSNKGQGSLHLSIDNRGLKYSFECPNTALGDEVLEGIQRGDISQSSFSFTVEKDRFERNADGSVIRYIEKVKMLYDVSPVWNPAYEDTSVSVDSRSYNEFIENENNNNKTLDTVIEERNDEILDRIEKLLSMLEGRSAEVSEEEVETRNEEEPQEEKEEERSAECTPEKEEEEERSECDAEEECSDEEQEEDEESEERNNVNTITSNTMEKFSLVKAIRDVAEGRSMDEATLNVTKEGRSAMQKANLTATGQIVIPAEMRSDNTNGQTTGVFASVATQGQENVGTDLLGIVEPLRNALVQNGAGFTYMGNLVGDVEIPFYSGSNCGWAGETEAAQNGEGTWSKIKLSPRRLCCFIDISKQFLLQDSNDAEAMLRRDLVNAIREKIEMTLFGDSAGDSNRPEGLFNGVVANTTAWKYDDFVDMQAELMSANINGAYKYVVSPSAYAAMRLVKMDTGSGRFYLEGNTTVDGIPVIVSNSVTDKGVVLGDFSELIFAQWGGIDIVVDNISRAHLGQVRIVVNFYVDVQPRRKEALVAKIGK